MLKRVLLPVLTVALVGSLAYVGVVGSAAGIFDRGFWRAMITFGDAIHFIHHHYLEAEEADYDALTAAALDGMMATLDDYSGHLEGADFAAFAEETQQQFVGIGVRVASWDDDVTVVQVFPGGPAAEAGLRAGDRILAVDGALLDNGNTARAADLIRGPEGTVVTLTLARDEATDSFDLDVDRRPVLIPSVHEFSLDDEGFAYVRISQFGTRTEREFRALLPALREGGARALIIDVRSNPGGVLTSTLGVLDPFFPRGTVLLQREGRGYGDAGIHRARRSREIPAELPVAVLVDRHSASGAEILAGVLRDLDRAVIVGERTVGKGSVQSIHVLPNGSGLRQTTAEYLLPGGDSLAGRGLEPDVPVDLTAQQFYYQGLQRFHTARLDPETFRERFGDESLDDPILEAAREALRRELRGLPPAS